MKSAKAKILFGDELAYPGEYLAVEDLKGKPRPVIIESVSRFEGRKSGDKEKLVVTLVGKKKKWIINVTNAETIAEVYGRQALDWVGCTVWLQPDVCQVGRDRNVPCVRVSLKQTKAAKAGVKTQEPAQTEREPGWDDLQTEPDEAEIARMAAEAEQS